MATPRPSWIPKGATITIKQEQLTGPGGVPAGTREVLYVFDGQTSYQYGTVDNLKQKGLIPDTVTSLQDYVADLDIDSEQVDDQTTKKTSNQTQNSTGNAADNIDNTTDVPDASNVQVDATALLNSDEFKTLPPDQQEIVKQVYELIATNNQEQAQKLAAAFKTSAAISDPFFRQELRLAADAVERGFVSIEKEEEFKLEQIRNRKADLEQDLSTQKEFLNLEEANALRQIDRQFDQDIKATRQTLASRGFSSSSRRSETEQLLEESTGDLRESTTRKFGLQKTEIDRTAERAQRDTQSEIERLREITTENKLDFLRSGEAQIGTDNLNKTLPNLSGDVAPLGDIVGDIPRQQTEDIIRGAQNLIF